MEIYVSSIHRGTNLSAGPGIARSLRDAYPDARIIGVDYSTGRLAFTPNFEPVGAGT